MDVRGLASSGDVAQVAAIAKRTGRFGIDTEFISEGRYRALLCLVQVAVDDSQAEGGTRIILVDALDAVDPGPIASLLADPEIEVVLHAGRQDIAILRRTWQTTVSNVFDTQLAAGFAGGGAQTGYNNLIGAMLGRRVGKTASYTRWDARPLSAEQLRYAAEDVAYLIELADEIQRRLGERGRLEWAEEECRLLESSSDERDPYEVWQRLPRVNQLDPRARAVARELAAWRERSAAAEDRPVGSVLADAALVELAKRQPSELQTLEQIRGLHRSGIRRRGREILSMIDAGREAEPIAREEARARSDPADAPLIALAESLLRARALESSLAYELISSRAELEQIIAAKRRSEPDPPVRTLTGWRHELVGADLSELLAGRSALAVGEDGRVELSAIRSPA